MTGGSIMTVLDTRVRIMTAVIITDPSVAAMYFQEIASRYFQGIASSCFLEIASSYFRRKLPAIFRR
jgi:hypothetical protein